MNAPLLGREDAVRPEIHRVRAVDQGGVARDVFRTAEPMRAGCVDVAAVVQDVQVGNLRAEVRASVGPEDDAAADAGENWTKLHRFVP